MKKYYIIENLDMNFNTLDECKKTLEKVLYDESNYNYSINKKNEYTILKVVYNDITDNEDYYELSNTISVHDFKEMSYEEKEEFFKDIKEV